MKANKIVHLTQAVGGVRTYINNIIFHGQDFFEYIVITSDQEYHHELIRKGIKTYLLPMTRGISVTNLFSVFRLNKILAQENPDIVHCHSAIGGAVGRAAKLLAKSTSFVYTPHAFSYLSFRGAKRGGFVILEKLFRYLTDKVIAVSSSEKRQAVRKVGYESSKVEVVLNGSNVPITMKDDFNFKGIVGMVGRITEQKNPLQFAYLASQIVPKYPNVKFVLLGSGLHDHLLDHLNQFIKGNDLTDNFEILKWGYYSDINQFYEKIDIFLLTSKFEGSPFSLVEAMAYGLPCLASNVDGNKDVIMHGENGLLYDTNEDMVNLCIELIDKESYREELGIKARKYISDQLNTKGQVVKIEEIYKKTLE